MLYIRDLIRKKKNGEELTEDEIEFFISAYHKEEILREQAATLITLMHTKGLSEKEIAFLSTAIADSGEKLNLYELSNQIIDIHPIGGMDDKIVIMLLAIMSALEKPSVKLIGRKIHKLHEISKNELTQMIEQNKIWIFEEPENIAPVENKLYKLRNDIACNDDISIIAINLMSQKIALGFRNIIFDISYGEKAYIKNLRDAEKLARYLIKMGVNLNKKVKCLITKLEEPVGYYFGNILELKEALEGLNGNMALDVKELILEFGSNMMQMINVGKNIEQNKKEILKVIESKKAYYKLIELVLNGKKDINFVEAKHVVPIMSTIEGYIEKIDMSTIRTTAQYLKAIRHISDNEIDIGTGIKFCKKIGDKVEVLLGYIYTNDETKVQEAVQNVKQAFKITNKKIKRKSRIIEVL